MKNQEQRMKANIVDVMTLIVSSLDEPSPDWSVAINREGGEITISVNNGAKQTIAKLDARSALLAAEALIRNATQSLAAENDVVNGFAEHSLNQEAPEPEEAPNQYCVNCSFAELRLPTAERWKGIPECGALWCTHPGRRECVTGSVRLCSEVRGSSRQCGGYKLNRAAE